MPQIPQMLRLFINNVIVIVAVALMIVNGWQAFAYLYLLAMKIRRKNSELQTLSQPLSGALNVKIAIISLFRVHFLTVTV